MRSFLISREIAVSKGKKYDLLKLLESAFDFGLMKNVDFYADETDVQRLSPLLFLQAPNYATFFRLFDRLGPFVSNITLPKFSSFFLFSFEIPAFKGPGHVQKVHSHPLGAVNKQIDSIINMTSRADF